MRLTTMSFTSSEEDMQNTHEALVETKCKELLNAFQGVLWWKWDSRFEAALAEFNVASKDKILAILNQYFTSVWDSSNISKAPRTVKDIKNHLGDLRTSQMLFTSDTTRNDCLYCAWWPWGDARTVSIRIAPWYKDLPASEKAGRMQAFKNLIEK